jgi:protein tyrosine/serine phosphatase
MNSVILFPIGLIFLNSLIIQTATIPQPMIEINLLNLTENDIVHREYNKTSYNCVNFSKDLQENLSRINVSSIRLIVDNNYSDNATHEILAILIEPQSGKTIPIGEYDIIKIDEPKKNRGNETPVFNHVLGNRDS